MPRRTARARVLAGLYAVLGAASSASAAKRFRAGEPFVIMDMTEE